MKIYVHYTVLSFLGYKRLKHAQVNKTKLFIKIRIFPFKSVDKIMFLMTCSVFGACFQNKKCFHKNSTENLR